MGALTAGGFLPSFQCALRAKIRGKRGPGIAEILDTLRGSDEAEIDRTHFLAAQLLFWLLAAPDGHAKNFSLFLEPHGRFRLTPFYDILSAWPVIGEGARQVSWQKLNMAMAVRVKNAHYRMATIQRRHWNAVAKNNAMGMDFEVVIQRFIEMTPTVIETVSAQISSGFSERLCDAIFNGVSTQVDRLQSSA